MFWSWWKARRRRKLLAQPFPAAWEDWLRTNCRQYRDLSADEQLRLRQDVRLLIAEKNWEGCNGLTVTPEMQVTIAAHAALMALGFPALPFERLVTILIYPDAFIGRRKQRISGDLPAIFGEQAFQTAEAHLGEAWYQDVVILVWREIQEQCQQPAAGRNVVIHEFAHLLDMEDQAADGLPNLDNEEQYETWLDVTSAEFERLRRQIRLGRRTLLDSYATTNPAEFFAVASETFFEQPLAFRAELPNLYAVLRAFYRQDPAARQVPEAKPPTPAPS